ncbi:MAG: MBL fold metallo-hydrolase [Candidatus Bathyarchaeota archaeon]|nr:MBL fold metallo-hydrolase [Candidatus Bathyarchaeota archaeon]
MELKVRQRGGTIIEYGDQGVILDPTSNSHSYPTFVSHAHADHAAAFKHPEREKYATTETYRLLEAMGWKRLDNLNQVKVGDTVKLDEIEVKIHNSGHVLGSVQFEVNTPEGTVLYTGDMCTENTFTMDPATPVECDLLIIETTFGAPMFQFPKRNEIAVEVYQWAVNTVINGRIPTFKTDSIGNAQEIISILNKYTNLPVVTTKSATKVTDVYRESGYNLDSVDANSDEGRDLIDSGKCAIITPKGSKVPTDLSEMALASGWAVIMNRGRVAFPLSDHADYKGLLGFIRKCKPKRVLTFHGGKMTKDFHNHIKNTLRIPASPLSTRVETIKGPLMKNENRVLACSRQIIRTIRIPGFVYQPTWLAKEMSRQGFSTDETENSIELLIEKGILKGAEGGVRLT